MLQSFLLKLYFRFYHYYIQLWEFLFAWIKQIILVYYIDKNITKNITFNYYTGHQINKYEIGKFYSKIYDLSGTKHVAFAGNLEEINQLAKIEIQKEAPPKRKQIILAKDSEPINIDLVVLDNYKVCMSKMNNPITNLGEILHIMGIDCTHVVILEMIPFKKITISVADVDINQLYN